MIDDYLGETLYDATVAHPSERAQIWFRSNQIAFTTTTTLMRLPVRPTTCQILALNTDGSVDRWIRTSDREQRIPQKKTTLKTSKRSIPPPSGRITHFFGINTTGNTTTNTKGDETTLIASTNEQRKRPRQKPIETSQSEASPSDETLTKHIRTTTTILDNTMTSPTKGRKRTNQGPTEDTSKRQTTHKPAMDTGSTTKQRTLDWFNHKNMPKEDEKMIKYHK